MARTIGRRAAGRQGARLRERLAVLADEKTRASYLALVDAIRLTSAHRIWIRASAICAVVTLSRESGVVAASRSLRACSRASDTVFGPVVIYVVLSRMCDV